MKALSLLEIDQILENLKNALGSKVQNVFYQGNQYLLELWSSNLKKHYLFFDVNSQAPFCFFSKEKIYLDKEKFKSPVGLFSKKHLVRKQLIDIFFLENCKNTLVFNFDDFFINFTILRVFTNLKVSYDNKSLHWYKVKNLDQSKSFKTEETKTRSIKDLIKEWKDSKLSKQKKSLNKPKNKNNFLHFIKNKIKNIKRALEKNKKDIESRQKAADFAKTLALNLQTSNKLSSLSKEQIDSIQQKKSWGWNMSNQLNLHKKLNHKLNQTKNRQKDLINHNFILETLSEDVFLKNLDIEINLDLLKKCKIENLSILLLNGEKSYKSAFEKGFFKKFLASKKKISTNKNKDKDFFAKIPKKTLLLDSGNLVLAGKNAKANIALLRQAKAWHIWLHLKDYPSSHAIILSEKSQKISNKEMIQVAKWLVKMHSKKTNLSTIKIDVVYTQCRFVKSIKGDSLGRVSYTNEKTILL